MTSSKEPPQVEFQDRKNEKIELRLLAAITKVPKSELTEIIESTLEGRLKESGVTFVKEPPERGHEYKHLTSIKKGKCQR